MKLGITGHQDIPGEAIEEIQASIMKLIGYYAPASGISCLAAGADQLFASCILLAHIDLEVIIPCSEYEHLFSGSDAREYRRLLNAATQEEQLPFNTPTEEAFFAAGRRVVDLSDFLIAIWDGGPAEGVGGTAHVVRYAKSRDVPTIVVWPEGLKR